MTPAEWADLPADPLRERIAEVIASNPRVCSCGFRCFLPGRRGRCRWYQMDSDAAADAVIAAMLVLEGFRRVKAGPGAVCAHMIKDVLSCALEGFHHPVGYLSEGEVILGALAAGVEVFEGRGGVAHLGISRLDLRVLEGSERAAERRAEAGLPPLWTGSRTPASQGRTGSGRNPGREA